MKMKIDSELTMAINSTFNSILNQIQLSNLNFAINLTPYAAYITLKKTAQVDQSGMCVLPTPPLVCLLKQALDEKATAEHEMSEAKCTIEQLQMNNNKLAEENQALADRLNTVKESLNNLEKQYGHELKEFRKTIDENKKLQDKISASEKFHSEHTNELDLQIKTMKKSIKIDEKEVHNLKVKFTNLQDANANLKAELSSSNLLKKKAERKVKKLEQKVEVKKLKETVSAQTEPSSLSFFPQLSLKTQLGYFSQSMPSIYCKDGVDEKFKCNICGLSFVTASELDDHNDLYNFCCRMCFTCFQPVQESELCCLDAENC